MASSSSSSAHHHQQQHRSILAIDLNEIPSPSETLPSPSSSSFILSPTSLVRSIHDNPLPPEGPPAEIPDDSSPACSGCGLAPPKAASERLVCDGCERGFHFGCAGVTAALLPLLEEWVCRDCAGEGVGSRRWPLGRRKKEGGVRLLDMNASPPSDGDGEVQVVGNGGGSGMRDLRKQSVGEDAFHGYTPGGPLLYSNLIYSSNGFGLHKVPGLVAHTARLDFQDVLHHKFSIARSFEDIAYSSQLGRIRSSNTTFRYPSRSPNEVLQSLREFVSERHGILEEGWRVEFKQLKNGCESYAVYCAPDGSIFETMSDVACYLGLVSNGNAMEPEARSDDGSSLRRNGLHLPKRRKITRLPIGNGLIENGGSLIGGYNNNFLSSVQTDQFSTCKREKMVEVVEPVHEENGADDICQFHEGLPLQYEDFFILSLGKIDARTSYHNSSQIWPVGYRSCWHDKITGSLFLCDILDGGDTGPVFKVRRFSCSALPIPYGSTVLTRRYCVQSDSEYKNEREMLTTPHDDCCIEVILADPGLPVEGDALSFLLSGPNEADAQKTSHSSAEPCSSRGMPQDSSDESSPVGEKIGEFSVDGCSASVVWNILSQKLADACCQIFKQMGSLKFFCKHVEDGTPSIHEILNDKNRSSLDKFCSLSGSLKVPSVVKSHEELDSTIEALKNWMNMDRFGVDVEFVQELVEQSPDAHKCLQYEYLRRRNDHSKLPLVGNGLLLMNGKSIDQCQDTVLDGLYREYKANREPITANYSRPIGKHLGLKLPPHLVGDVLQVWELLRRFHEILSLEPLDFNKMEEELISPWFKSFSDHGPCETISQGGPDGSSVRSEQTSSSSSEADQPEENRFIRMEPAVMSEEAHRQALSTYSNCACLSLRRAHIALLDVLVSELQIKVAAVVDPSIDGEPKSRRGRRKDVDSSILAIRPKLNLLPINELTWPELARRYTLALLSMDGNLDLAETGMGECGKVFRCLQGDGGVLCGSLIGLAGIEADAQLLAEATKRIYGAPTIENDLLMIEDDDPDPVGASGKAAPNNGDIPEWAQPLEPVRKLPTNVGTRIRKCVYEALEKDPPDWARKILEHSISKEVYKGNASGPTKKAVLSVLANVVNEGSQQKARKERKKKTVVSISDIIMRQCRILLRRAASADEEKVFCNLVGRNLMNSSENDEEGLLGSPAMVARPLDFRTIDLRLAVGAYGGSHEAFLEDVRELWKNIRIAHADQPELVQLAETLSQNFESLYEEEELGRLASVMERKDYWEFRVDERILLLKFLCDEVLNSILIRQHLEQCFETSADLQQKLRLLHSEWKSLKLREDSLATKAAKLGLKMSDVAGESKTEECGGTVADHNICTGPQPADSDRCDQIASALETASKFECVVDALNSSSKDGCQNMNHMEKDVSCGSEVKQPVDSAHQVEDAVEGVNEDAAAPESHDFRERSSKRHKSSSLHESSVSNPLPCGTTGIDSESSLQGTVSKSEDLQGAFVSSSTSNELQACKLDLVSVQKDLSSLQQSIAHVELQLLKSSVRMEFLGSDSSGQLYWVSVQPGAHPWVIVDGTMALKHHTQGMSSACMGSTYSFSKSPAPCASDSHLNSLGSNAPCPFVYGQDCTAPSCSPWFFYESDIEIRGLVKSLKDTDPKERELKDSILHLQRLRFHELYQTGKQDKVSQVVSTSREQNDACNLATKASIVLEHKYGSFFQTVTEDHLNKRGRRSRVITDEKLYRCKCLEPIWLSRHHCLSCHGTFFTAEELDQHNDGNCKPRLSVSGKKKPSDESSWSLGTKKSKAHQQVQNEELMCPYKFDDISSKFVTNDSIKELVHGIGLIGSEGRPSFVPTVSPYLTDPTLTVLPQADVVVAVDQSNVPKKEVGHSDQIIGKSRVDNMPDACPRRVPAKKHVVDPHCVVPECSLRPLVGRAAQILRQLKINLLDMEAALPEEAFREWKVQSQRRRAWHAFVKAAETIFEATIVFEDMIKTEYLKNEWWYWSSLSAAAKTSTLSSLALRIYALDNAVLYERTGSNLNRTGSLKISSEEDHQSPSNMASSEKSKQARRANKKRKEETRPRLGSNSVVQMKAKAEHPEHMVQIQIIASKQIQMEIKPWRRQLADKVDFGVSRFLSLSTTAKAEKACCRIGLLQNAASHFTKRWSLPQIEREEKEDGGND
ncbi:hypothetical protein Cgig2_012615 [Carnegiea gigantea]|uniref:Methyl-CpG-binding domain-containing protein 9 n=1 Tax=Carnegiea gigantea TaxID=171969 RepID=A0A9Q1K0U7_9CARY|nr:hypothetical protein Cgig2_012615 [Carnegiea gigantea]